MKRSIQKNINMNRRSFIQQSSMAVAGMTLSGYSNEQIISANSLRKIGTLEVSPLGLGCMNMAGVYNVPMPKDEMIKVIRKAFDNGITFLDTAEVYGPFFSEEIVGEAIKPFRQMVSIATKFGFSFNGNETTGRGSRPDQIKKAIDGSLKRLQIESIDLAYLHRADPNVPIEDVAGTVKELITAGKIKNFGLSEVSPETITRANAVQKVAALQSEYSLLERVVENEILSLCEQLTIAFVPWGPLARGFLTGKYDENSKFEFRKASVSYLNNANLVSNMELYKFVKAQAQNKDITPAQFSLAWLLAQKPFIIPIPGTTNQAHLLENIGGMNISFTNNELKEIRKALLRIEIKGVRSPKSVHENQ